MNDNLLLKAVSASRLCRGAALGLALAGAVAAPADYSSTVQADAPLGWWRLGETPAVYTDTITNYGTLGGAANGVGYTVAHGVAGALAGSADTALNVTDGVVIMGSAASFNFTGTASFTLEAWVKLTAPITGASRVIANGISGQGYAFGFQTANTLRLTGYGVADVSSDAAPVNFPLNEWLHIAVVRNGTAVRFFTNGVLFGAQKSLANIISTARPLVLGRNSSFGEPFNGAVDEAAVYSVPLADSALAAHYTAGATVGGDYPAAVLADSPIGYWRLNEPPPPAPETVANSGSVGTAGNGAALGAQGSVTGGAAGALAGDPNTAMGFNGVDGKIQVPHNAGLNPTRPRGASSAGPGWTPGQMPTSHL